MRNKILLFLLTFIGISQIAAASTVRDKYNFNSEWLLYVGDIPEAKEVRFQDTDWKKVTLPRPFNEDEAFRLSIEQLTDTVGIGQCHKLYGWCRWALCQSLYGCAGRFYSDLFQRAGTVWHCKSDVYGCPAGIPVF